MQTYADRSGALRGAKRAGITNPIPLEGSDGRWYIEGTEDAAPAAKPVKNKGSAKANKRKNGSKHDGVKNDGATNEGTVADATADDVPTEVEIQAEADRHNTEVEKHVAGSVNQDEIDKFLEENPPPASGDGSIVVYAIPMPMPHIDPATGKLVPKRPGGAETYKALEAKAPPKSLVGSPVSFVWDFLDAHPGIERKQAIASLVNAGCNINMARSQFQLYRANAGVRKTRGK